MGCTGPASAGSGSSVTEPTMPFDLVGRILETLEPNDRAIYGRFVCKPAWRRLSLLRHRTARFSLPLPKHFVGDHDWQPHLQQAFKQLNFHRKMRVLSGAASSKPGAGVGPAAALPVPELLAPPYAPDDDDFYFLWVRREDAGTAAMRSGHAHLLPWLVRHRCPLEPYKTLAAAAEHCNLAGLQQAWELLGGDSYTGHKRNLVLHGLAKAAAKPAGNAAAKLSWLLTLPGEIPQARKQPLLRSAAEGAATSGTLPVLRWLWQQGLDLCGAGWSWSRGPLDMVAAALEHGHVAVADWLVDEAGCPLPQEEQQANERRLVWGGAARGGSMQATRWLLRRGVPVHRAAIEYAAGAGRLEAVQFLHWECGLELTEEVFKAAVYSRSLPTAAWLCCRRDAPQPAGRTSVQL